MKLKAILTTVGLLAVMAAVETYSAGEIGTSFYLVQFVTGTAMAVTGYIIPERKKESWEE